MVKEKSFQGNLGALSRINDLYNNDSHDMMTSIYEATPNMDKE